MLCRLVERRDLTLLTYCWTSRQRLGSSRSTKSCSGSKSPNADR